MTGNYGPQPEDDGIAAVAGSFSGLHMDRGIEGITRRARTLSVRRRAVPTVAAVAFVAAGAAVVVSSPAHSTAPAAAVANPAAGSTIGNLELTGFTVQNDASTGIITVLVKNFDNPDGLIAALAKDGVKVQIYHQNAIPAAAVEKFGTVMGYSGDTYFYGPAWTKESDGTYKITINVKALGPDRVQPLTIVKGY